MNTIFNFSRFLKILSIEWRLNIKKMLLFWGCMIIIAVIFFAVFRFVDPQMINKDSTFLLFFFLMCILQGFYIQIYFREFSSKTKTQALLLLPASRNETFWAKFLLGVILYLILFSALIFITLKWNEMHNAWIKEFKYFPENDWRYSHFEEFQRFRFALMEILIFFLVWIFSVSAYLFGIMSFKKLAAFKSLALWFIVIVGLCWITAVVYALFTGVLQISTFPGMHIGTNICCDQYLANYQIFWGGSEYCAIYKMYPELLYGIGLFICLALIFISRIKYNEKTV